MKRILWSIFTILVMNACKNNETNITDSSAEITTTINIPANLPYTIVNVYPHDTAAYTQGLEFHNGFLYEGTGLNGESFLRKAELSSSKTLQRIDLAKEYFGEGITVFNNKIYQLTWQNHKVFVYELKTFKKIKELDWAYEGWGLSNNGKQLIITTGSNNVYFVNPENLQIEKTLSVYDNNGPLANLNEPELVNGALYANVYQTDHIVRIDTASGAVTAQLDLSNILEKNNQPIYPNRDYLNGIAYDSGKQVLYVTGKKWPALFALKLN
ncbi:MAG: glutaminyl-peptide cyclotransferase [Chitinophagaceae bacterium]|nr:glutaminyl-peptide cyclotransferase [Chitinophagaceae bacterium]